MKTNLIGLLLVGGLLLLAWGCNEETYVEPLRLSAVRGKVLYSESRKPARNVLIRLSPSSRSTETDSSGTFRFDSVSIGKYTLQTTLLGYISEFSAIEIADQQTTVVTMLLRDDKSQNRAPTIPTAVRPGHGTDSVQINPTLRWKSTDPERDSIRYDIAIYQSGSVVPFLFVTDLKKDSMAVKSLAYNTVYTWQVTAKDGVHSVRSDIFSFRTRAIPDLAYVFARRVAGQLQLFTSDTTTSAVQLTSEGSNWRPTISPNRQRIAFISNQTTDLHLVVMDRDGRNQRQITTLPLAGLVPTNLSFCWSPDGTQLVYPVNDRLYTIRADGTGLSQVAKVAAGEFFSGCDWTSQGNQLVARVSGTDPYVNRLVLINPQTGIIRPLPALVGRVSNPVFSVDGQQVLISRDLGTFVNEQGRQLNARLLLISLKDNTLTDISGSAKPIGTNDLDPRFAPNGARIIFTNADNTGLGAAAVVSMTLSGQDRRVLFRPAEMPFWR